MASSTAAPIIPNATISSTDRIARAHQAPFCARGLLKIIAVSEKGAGAHGNVPRAGGCSTDGTPETAHTWQGREPQRAMPGMRPVQVAAETPETAHTWQRRMPQRAMPGMRTVQVAAETQKTAHTWQQRASAMGKRRTCDGRPHRAVQNQAFCCTGRPRQTVRCRKWPCGVREARLNIGGCARRWQQEQVQRKVRHTSGGG